MLGSQDIEEGNHQMEDGCREVTCEEVICSVTVITLDGNQAFIEMILMIRMIIITLKGKTTATQTLQMLFWS